MDVDDAICGGHPLGLRSDRSGTERGAPGGLESPVCPQTGDDATRNVTSARLSGTYEARSTQVRVSL